MKHLLMRVSATVLAFLLYDFCVRRIDADGVCPALMTYGVGRQRLRTNLMSCTPWGIFLEAWKIRTALEVMDS